MSIESMSFVNILGDLNFLDECILKLINFKMFHIEQKKEKASANFKNLNEQNPYIKPLNTIKKIINILEIKKDLKISEDLIYSEELSLEKQKEIIQVKEEIEKIKEKIRSFKDSLKLISHMKNLDAKIKDVLKTDYIKAHFGRLLKTSYLNLKHMENKDFFFIPQDEDEEFCWGFYITHKNKDQEISEFFKKMYFVECFVPQNIEDNPKVEIKKIENEIKNLNEKLKNLNIYKENFKDENETLIKKTYIKFKTLHDSFSYRKFAVANEKQFNICGFIPTKKISEFKNIFKDNNNIVFEFMKDREEKEYSPPVKLKTCRLFKPFEMYVTTYGTPNYKSFNPSSLIGLIYSLVFGIMFGDLGQGFLLFIGGFIAHKKMKNNLGLILTRCGFCSMIFGLVFDSIFGFEGLLEQYWERFSGLKWLPFHLLKPSNSIPILMISCLIGMAIILVSILVNIFLNLKTKNLKEALFSHNGLAGLLFYGGCATAALSLLLFKKNLFSPIFISLIIVVPILLIFFSIPLGNLVDRNSSIEREKFSVSSSFFDMIDILLSYFTNTLSFLRVGGLALSHAALMLVVMKFAQMAGSINTLGPVAFTIVVILGNAFIVVLEGLIVSIQALRLIYYEIFSRFFQGNGKPFNPVKINYKN